MPASTIQRAVSGTVLCAWLALLPIQTTLACTRAVYFGQDAQTVTGRSMDWVNLDQIDFKPGTGVRRLTLHGNPGLGGDQTANFKKAQAFMFLAPR